MLNTYDLARYIAGVNDLLGDASGEIALAKNVSMTDGLDNISVAQNVAAMAIGAQIASLENTLRNAKTMAATLYSMACEFGTIE